MSTSARHPVADRLYEKFIGAFFREYLSIPFVLESPCILHSLARPNWVEPYADFPPLAIND
jgi:hypothetical protein